MRRRHGQSLGCRYPVAIANALFGVDDLFFAANAPQAVLRIGIVY